MSKHFDMELLLAGVLTGSQTTRKRHLRQAKVMQNKIAERWQRETPWAWQKKHVTWFLKFYLCHHTYSTRYYYLLTTHLITRRLEKSWIFYISH